MTIFRFLTYFMFLFSLIFSTDTVFAVEDTEATQLVESQEDDGQEDSEGEEDVLSSVGENILTNASFHKTIRDGKMPKGWKKVVDGNNGNGLVDPNVQNGKNGSVQVWSSPKRSGSYIAITQEIPVMPDTTYTLKGNLKTRLPKGAGAFFNTQQLDQHKEPLHYWRGNHDQTLTGQHDAWINRELTFHTNPNTAYIMVFLEVQHAKGSLQEGSAWFTDVTLARVDEKKKVVVSRNSGGQNLLQNANFEQTPKPYVKEGTRYTIPPGWTLGSVGDKGHVNVDKNEKKSGTQSVQLFPKSTRKETSWVGLTQIVPVKRNTTYTLSGYIRTNRLKNAFSYFNTEQLDKNKKTLTFNRWTDNKYSQLTGTKAWTKRHVTFHTFPDTHYVKIYLEVDHSHQETSGCAWFDQMQLEEGCVSTRYNFVENGGFTRHENHASGLSRWHRAYGEALIDSTEAYVGVQSVQMNRKKMTDALKQLSQVISIHQNEPRPITISGMVQGQDVECVSQKPNASFGIVFDALTDENEYHVTDTVEAPLGDYGWRRISKTIHPTKPIKQVNVYVQMGGDTIGTAWFDNIHVQEGNALTIYEADATTSTITEPVGNAFQVKKGREVLECTDGKGNTFRYTYNEYDQLISLEVPGADVKVHYAYDADGNLIEKRTTSKDGNSIYNEIRYEYNEVGELLKIVDPLHFITCVTQEALEHGRKTTIVFADQTTMTIVYDEEGRILEESYCGFLRYRYAYTDHSVHILDTLTNQSRECHYNDDGSLTRVVMDGKEMNWAYDGENVIEQSLQDGLWKYTHHYGYNERGQNTLVVHPNGGKYRMDYDEEGSILILGFPNRTHTSLYYDDNGRMTSIQAHQTNGEALFTCHYAYDENNNRTKIVDHNGRTMWYTYDEQDQLLSETHPLTGNTMYYTYDPVGNRVKKVMKDQRGNALDAVAYAYNAANQLTRVGDQTYRYDRLGNLIDDGEREYIWDYAGRLSEVKNKGEKDPIASFSYDENGRRIRSVINKEVTNYVYDGDSINVLYETNEKDEVTRLYTYSATGHLLSMQKSTGEVYYYHYNAHEDVVCVTDEKEQPVARYVYDAWGNIVHQEGSFASGNPYRYAGYRYDQELGLYYLLSRYYNPKNGNFLSLDAASGELEDLHTQNGYCYVGNNPVMQTDPTGEVFWFAVNAACAACDGYQAYKGGASVGEIACVTAIGFVGGGKYKVLEKVRKGITEGAKRIFSKGVTKGLPRGTKGIGAKVKGKPANQLKKTPATKSIRPPGKATMKGSRKPRTENRVVAKKKSSSSSSSSNSSRTSSSVGKSKKTREKGSGKKPDDPVEKHEVGLEEALKDLSPIRQQHSQYILWKFQKKNGLKLKLDKSQKSLRSVERKSKSGTNMQNSSVGKLIKTAKPGDPTKGRTTQYELHGGYDKAVKDFKSLNPTVTKDSPEIKLGILPDGRKINVRIESTDKRPTLEIQRGKNKIKFRYNE